MNVLKKICGFGLSQVAKLYHLWPHKKARVFLNRSLIVFASIFLFGCQKNHLDYDLKQHKATNIQPVESLNSLASFSSLDPFKVMSFNIRRDWPGDPHTIVGRRPYIKQIILDNDPDIFGLQEYQDTLIKVWLKSEMATAGYDVYDDTPAGGGSPKAVYFKSSKYTKIRAGAEKIIDPSAGTDKASWIILQNKTTLKKYFISNSHWHPSSATNRIENAHRIITMVKSENTEDLPIIVFGDFNANPNETAYKNLKDSLDVEDTLGDIDGGFTFHGWDAVGDKKLDYIMISRNLSYAKPIVIETIYGSVWPSDHWPVMATITSPVFGDRHVDPSGLSAVSTTQYFFGDIDGDGDQDKIFWRSTYDGGRPRVYLSNGDGTTASTPVTHDAGASTLATTKYYYADVNGDGKDDQILWDPAINGGKSTIYLATTGGSFSSTPVINPAGLSGVSTTEFHFADVNGDGKSDKIFWRYNYDSGRPRVFLATSGGSFNGTYISNVDGGVSTTADTKFYYADVDGDGKDDKIMWHPTLNSGKPTVYLSNGDGTFTLSNSFSNSGSTSGVSTTNFYFADVNGDGMADKIFWRPSYFLGKLTVNYALSSGSFDTTTFVLTGNSQTSDTHYYFADVNGDGKDDQIRWNYLKNSGKVSSFFGN